MDEEPYLSVPLGEYVDLINMKAFFLILRAYGIEEWEGWDAALADFLTEENLLDLPY